MDSRAAVRSVARRKFDWSSDAGAGGPVSSHALGFSGKTDEAQLVVVAELLDEIAPLECLACDGTASGGGCGVDLCAFGRGEGVVEPQVELLDLGGEVC